MKLGGEFGNGIRRGTSSGRGNEVDGGCPGSGEKFDRV